MSTENNFPGWPGVSTASDAAPNLFADSPFGEHWDELVIKNDDDQQEPSQQQDGGKIIYKLVTGPDGADLINQYRTDHLIAKEYGSVHDEKRDIVIYYETNHRYNTFGSVCFVKMNEMVRATLLAPKFGKQWRELIAESAVEDYPSEKVDAKRILEAIDFELETGGGFTSILEKIACRILKWGAEKIRENKFPDTQWDADRKDYAPFFKSVLVLDDMVNGFGRFQRKFYAATRSCREAGKWCKEYLGDLGNFINNCITGIIDFFTSIVQAINRVMEFIQSVMEAIKEVWAFICGLLNAVIDLFAGILDLTSFMLKLTKRDERQLVKELLEDFLEKLRTHPFGILESIKEYFETRYNGQNKYKLAYHYGEDVLNLILLIDMAAGIFKFIESAGKAFEDMVGWVKRLAKRSEEIRPLTKEEALRKWISKIRKSFYNHLDGEWGLAKKKIVGQGGHNPEVLGKNIRIKPDTVTIPDPPVKDLPFQAQIQIRYKNGQWLDKKAMSTFFPQNWQLGRIQEEILYVYENTYSKGIGLDTESLQKTFQKYVGKCTKEFDILLEIDKDGNIVNAYPIII